MPTQGCEKVQLSWAVIRVYRLIYTSSRSISLLIWISPDSHIKPLKISNPRAFCRCGHRSSLLSISSSNLFVNLELLDVSILQPHCTCTPFLKWQRTPFTFRLWLVAPRALAPSSQLFTRNRLSVCSISGDDTDTFKKDLLRRNSNYKSAMKFRPT